MFGFIFGTACLLGLTATVLRKPHCSDRARGGRAHGYRGGRARFVLNRLLDRLDTTPGQEKVIREAVEAFMDEFHDARGQFRGTRREIAQAVAGETLDRGAIESIFERHDQVIDGVRQNALESFSKVHETLDQRQRKILAELIESGPFGHGHGRFGRAHW